MLVIILSIVGLIRDILFILVILFIIRLASRWFKPSVSANRNQQRDTKYNHQEEGEMFLRFNKKGERMKKKNKDEYVDYEEVD